MATKSQRFRRQWIGEILAEKELAKKEAEALRRKRSRLWRKNNAKARKLDGDACRFCPFTVCLEVHHIVPVSEGGSDRISNLITLCPNHHAMAHRGLISREQFAVALARRTRSGRVKETRELMELIMRVAGGVGSDPAKLAEWHAAMRLWIPDRIGEIYGWHFVNASRDSFPPLPRGVSG